MRECFIFYFSAQERRGSHHHHYFFFFCDQRWPWHSFWHCLIPWWCWKIALGTPFFSLIDGSLLPSPLFLQPQFPISQKVYFLRRIELLELRMVQLPHKNKVGKANSIWGSLLINSENSKALPFSLFLQVCRWMIWF